MLLFLLVAVMLLLLFLTLRGLFFLASPGNSDSSTDDEAPPSGPDATVPFEGDVSTTAGVACGRLPDAAPDSSFLVEVVDPGTTGAVVALDLVASDGTRHARRVSVSPTSEGSVQVVVGDSGDGGGYVDCVITAIQRGQQVIFTGR